MSSLLEFDSKNRTWKVLEPTNDMHLRQYEGKYKSSYIMPNNSLSELGNNNNNNNNGNVERKGENRGHISKKSNLKDYRNVPCARAYHSSCSIGGRYVVIFGGEGYDPMHSSSLDAADESKMEAFATSNNTYNSNNNNNNNKNINSTNTNMNMMKSTSGLNKSASQMATCPRDGLGGYQKSGTITVNLTPQPIVCFGEMFVFDTVTKVRIVLFIYCALF